MSRLPNGLPRRIATLSVHTSPLDQPGTGDAGGLNVYVVQVAKRLAARGTEVEIFTRAVCRDTPPLTEIAPGVLVRSVVAGPFGADQLDGARALEQAVLGLEALLPLLEGPVVFSTSGRITSSSSARVTSI